MDDEKKVATTTGGAIGTSIFAIVRASLLDDNDEPMYVIGQSDFRETSGFMFPHRIEYLSGAGRTLAIETIDEIEVDVIPFELEQQTAAHWVTWLLRT